LRRIILFKYSFDNKRYHTLNYHLKTTFGEKLFKASIDAGLSCPNIDGVCATGGCTYCLSGSGEFTGNGSVTHQLSAEAERIAKKHKNAKLTAYFQAHTNTYAPVPKLRELYEEAIAFQNVESLSIATRPDCIGDDVLSLLCEMNEKTYLTVELGLQTIHDKTAEKINRGYDFKVFEDAFYRLRKNKIRICVHLIDGLIGEDYSDMIESAKRLGEMRPDAVKIHLLHVLRGTVCEKEYNENLLKTLGKDEYVDIVTEQLRYLPEECVIERLTGDGSKESLVAPLWSLAKISVLAAIDKTMAEKNIYQGDLCCHLNKNKG
jgi:hypothetical protein